MKCDYLVVGAGYSGCVIAERIATQLNKTVLIVDRRNHIGGNAFDFLDDHGILVHKYGPHIFHTNSLMVWNYLSAFTSWRQYYHKVLAVIEEKKVPVPFNLNSIDLLFSKVDAARLTETLINEYGFGVKVPILQLRGSKVASIRRLADFVYEKIFLGYTVKQWGYKPEDLDSSVTARVPIVVSRDDRYFHDEFQGIPSEGYTRMFERILAHKNIELLLSTDYRDLVSTIRFSRLIYTGPLDEYFDFMHGRLPYRSLRFELKNKAIPIFQEVGQINYPNDGRHTRITEFKHLTGQLNSTTTIAFEFPEPHEWGKNEPYYPIPRAENTAVFGRYEEEVRKLRGSVVFLGRLADYKYYNMDQVVARALSVFVKEIANDG